MSISPLQNHMKHQLLLEDREVLQKASKLCTQCGPETIIKKLGSKAFLFDATISKIYFS
jgi:hypothetical protein